MGSNELQVIDEAYKRGGRVKKSKKSKRKGTVKQTVIVNVGQTKQKRAGRRVGKAGKRQQMMPGAPSALTGMGSVVFGPSQAPSYFRAVGPDQQTFATLPGSLKAIQEGQAKTLQKLQYFEDEGKRQYERQQEFNQEVMEDYAERMRGPKASISVQSSRASTPRRSYSPMVSSSSLMPPHINTLNPLERQGSISPNILVPTPQMITAIPQTAVRTYSWSQALSSKEAGYQGADESLPIQAPASGANMVPEDVIYDAVPDSAFVPLGATAPESVDAAIERTGQVAAQAASPVKKNIKRPVAAKPSPAVDAAAAAAAAARAAAAAAPPAPAPAAAAARAAVISEYYMRNPDTMTTRDDLNFMASGLGIKNAKRDYTGPGATNRLRAAIKEAQRARQQ